LKTLIVNKDGSLAVKEIPIPHYNSKQALLKTVSCGICGTDSKLIHFGFKGFPKDVYPIMLGHEGVGEVVEVGSEVTSFKVGDFVLLPFNDPDAELYGDLGSGWGAYSEYGVVNDPAAFKKGEVPEVAYAQQIVPKDIDPVDAAMLITLREVLSNIKYFGIKSTDSVVVYGSGPVALTFIKFMNLLGITHLVAIARSEEKVKNVLEHGAAKALNSRECDVVKEIRKLYPDGVDYVLDAVGSPDIINQGMELIRDRGCDQYTLTGTRAASPETRAAPTRKRFGYSCESVNGSPSIAGASSGEEGLSKYFSEGSRRSGASQSAFARTDSGVNAMSCPKWKA
jgi:threonine dehydrogenase-like Zn-dependent dehydrogenase